MILNLMIHRFGSPASAIVLLTLVIQLIAANPLDSSSSEATNKTSVKRARQESKRISGGANELKRISQQMGPTTSGPVAKNSTTSAPTEKKVSKKERKQTPTGGGSGGQNAASKLKAPKAKKYEARMMRRSAEQQQGGATGQQAGAQGGGGLDGSGADLVPENLWNINESMMPTFTDQEQGDEMIALASDSMPQSISEPPPNVQAKLAPQSNGPNRTPSQQEQQQQHQQHHQRGFGQNQFEQSVAFEGKFRPLTPNQGQDMDSDGQRQAGDGARRVKESQRQPPAMVGPSAGPMEDYYSDDDDSEEELAPPPMVRVQAPSELVGAERGPDRAQQQHQQSHKQTGQQMGQQRPMGESSSNLVAGFLNNGTQQQQASAFERMHQRAQGEGAGRSSDGWQPAAPLNSDQVQPRKQQQTFLRQQSTQQAELSTRSPVEQAKVSEKLGSLIGGNSGRASDTLSALSRTDMAIEYLRNILKNKQQRANGTATRGGENEEWQPREPKEQPFYPIPMRFARPANQSAPRYNLDEGRDSQLESGPQVAIKQQIQSANEASSKFPTNDARQSQAQAESNGAGQQVRMAPTQVPGVGSWLGSTTTQPTTTTLTTTKAPTDQAAGGRQTRSESLARKQHTSSQDMPFAPIQQEAKLHSNSPAWPQNQAYAHELALSSFAGALAQGTPLGSEYADKLDDYPRSSVGLYQQAAGRAADANGGPKEQLAQAASEQQNQQAPSKDTNGLGQLQESKLSGQIEQPANLSTTSGELFQNRPAEAPTANRQNILGAAQPQDNEPSQQRQQNLHNGAWSASGQTPIGGGHQFSPIQQQGDGAPVAPLPLPLPLPQLQLAPNSQQFRQFGLDLPRHLLNLEQNRYELDKLNSKAQQARLKADLEEAAKQIEASQKYLYSTANVTEQEQQQSGKQKPDEAQQEFSVKAAESGDRAQQQRAAQEAGPMQSNFQPPPQVPVAEAIQQRPFKDSTQMISNSKLYRNGEFTQQQQQQMQQQQQQMQHQQQLQTPPATSYQPQPPQPPQMPLNDAHQHFMKPPKIVSYNYFESSPNEFAGLENINGPQLQHQHQASPANATQSAQEPVETNFQLGETLLSSGGDVEHLLSQAELEAIQSQFMTAEHPVVPVGEQLDQLPPQARHKFGSDQADQRQQMVAALELAQQQQQQQAAEATRLANAEQQSRLFERPENLQKLNQGQADELLKELGSSIEEQVASPARPLAAANRQAQAPLSAGREPAAREGAGEPPVEKRKSLIVYLNHPRESELDRETGGSALNEQSLAHLVREQTGGGGDPFVSAKEFDSHGLSKETKHLDVSNLSGLPAGPDGQPISQQQDKDGLSVVVIGDAYKYKKIVLMISAKAGGLKFIPMVKDM